MSVVELDKLGFEARAATRRSSRLWSLLRMLRSLARPRSESLETASGRAIEQAFAEFAKEMRR